MLSYLFKQEEKQELSSEVHEMVMGILRKMMLQELAEIKIRGEAQRRAPAILEIEHSLLNPEPPYEFQLTHLERVIREDERCELGAGVEESYKQLRQKLYRAQREAPAQTDKESRLFMDFLEQKITPSFLHRITKEQSELHIGEHASTP